MRKVLLAIIFVVSGSAPGSSQTVAIINGTVYPISGAPIANGTVVIRNGVIDAVGAGIPLPADATRIDATGKIVTPGLINSTTELGLIEIDQVRTTNDASARGNNNVAAAFKVWDGLNSESSLFAPTRNEGVTSAIIVPQGGLVSG